MGTGDSPTAVAGASGADVDCMSDVEDDATMAAGIPDKRKTIADLVVVTDNAN
jgi:hypothetical protein